MLETVHEVDVWDGHGEMPHDELLDRLPGVEGLYCMLTDRIDAAVVGTPGLRVVSQMAVGVDNVDLDAIRAAGIPLGHTPDVLTDATADLAVALLLAGARRLAEGIEHVKADAWGPWEPDLLLGADVSGSTVGIVGLGRIGQAVARRMTGFGCRLLVSSRTPKPDLEEELGVERVSFEVLLARADHVVLTVPLSDETRGMVDATALARMQPSAGLVNIARGPIVETDALVAALGADAIAYAALDVTDPEPIRSDHPLVTDPRCTVIPHLGSSTLGTRAAMAELAAENLLAGLAGGPMPARIA